MNNTQQVTVTMLKGMSIANVMETSVPLIVLPWPAAVRLAIKRKRELKKARDKVEYYQNVVIIGVN